MTGRVTAAIVRLWQRSPVWRALAGLAVVSAALALIYRPGPGPRVSGIEARYTPLTVGSILGPPYRTVATIGSRTVPLPPGTWNAIQRFVRKGDPPVLGISYVRLSGDQVTGIVVGIGNTTPADLPQRFPRSPACTRTDAYGARVIVSDDPNREECWGIVPLSPLEDWTRPNVPQLDRDLVARLREGGVKVPPVMVLAEWSQADDHGWFLAQYALTPPEAIRTARRADWTREAVAAAPDRATFLAGIKTWSTAWTILLERGAKGKLPAADVAAAAAENPE